jgi:hypothetical protein
MRLAELDGSVAEGTLQISEVALNEIAALSVEGSTQPTIELMPRNVLMLRYGVLHARAELPRVVGPEHPSRITLRLASLLVAMALKAVLHRPFVHVRGRYLTIDLANIPALKAWRDLWKHLTMLTFESTPGGLRIGFRLHVRESSGL